MKTHGMTNTRLYKIWLGIKERCCNKRCKWYRDYGARGIKVCDEWLTDFMSFYAWAMENGYQENLTIERIDNDEGYEPDNCRWATVKQQARNRRSSRLFTIGDETHCLSEWCEIYNINYSTALSRLRLNWPIEKVLELKERGN